MLKLNLSVNFVLNSLMFIIGALYWYLSISLDTDSSVIPVPDNAKGRVLTIRIITFIYSFIVAAWSVRYVSGQSKAAFFPSIFGKTWGVFLLRFGTFIYGVAIGIIYYIAYTICPNTDVCRKIVVTIQPLLGSLAIVTSVSFGGVLSWLVEHGVLTEGFGPVVKNV